MINLKDMRFQLFDADENETGAVLEELNMKEMPNLPYKAEIEGRIIEIKEFHDKTRFSVKEGRQVTVSLPEIDLEKLQKILEHYQASHDSPVIKSEVLSTLIHQAKLDRASYAPIYQDWYIGCDAHDEGSFLVESVDGSHTSYLKKLVGMPNKDDALYCVVEHSLEYPYAKYDYKEVVRKSKRSRRIGIEITPTIFCKAALVITPKMALVG